MQKKYDIVIPDASCLILLDKIGSLNLLAKIFQSLVITNEISKEFGKKIPEWISLQDPSENIQLSNFDLDPGESSIIKLSLQLENTLLILDDKKARKVASKMNLNYTGTLGIFLKAKRMGFIPSVQSIIDKVQSTNFRYSQKIYEEILLLADEAY